MHRSWLVATLAALVACTPPRPDRPDEPADTQPPVATITRAPGAATASTSATFEFSADEAGCTFSCRLDDADAAPCTSPASFEGLAEGAHSFAVLATDPAGNKGLAKHEWRVDTIAPTARVLGAPSAVTNRTSAIFEFDANEPGCAFTCRLDEEAPAPCTSPATFPGLGDGAHVLALVATDAAGHASEPLEHSWTVDTVGPESTISAGPAALTAEAAAAFTFRSSDEGATFECRLDGGAFEPCTSPKQYAGLADGAHVFAVRATDPAGNAEPSAESRTWTIDTQAPDTTIGSGPAALVTDPSSTFVFAAGESGATFECRVDAEPFAPCTSPKGYARLADGARTFEVRALDAAKNRDQTPARHAWTIDTQRPETVILESPPAATPSRSARFTFASNEAPARFECALDGASFAPCTPPVTHDGLAMGTHAFEVVAIDSAGHRDATPARHQWSITGTARLRLVAANATSGTMQRYEDAGIRILKGLNADVAMIQEFNYLDPTHGLNTPLALRAFVDRAFGPSYEYWRESGSGIPNGIVSRYPIIAAGEWDNPVEETRDFVWARIDVPGPHDLWAVSLHLRAGRWLNADGTPKINPETNSAYTDNSTRDYEVRRLLEFLAGSSPQIPASDYVVVGGDLNTQTRGELCMQRLRQTFADASGPAWPVDQLGVDGTSTSRTKPYDWVVVDADLKAFHAPVVIGANRFPNGLVFDSRVYTPLADVAPVELGDSGASNMQHMAVVRDFLLPE